MSSRTIESASARLRGHFFMLTPLILFLGLTVATAVIAHWSDNLGKKLGKKRVSLFGLRPRTTATILTVASSWGIMFLTLAALLITYRPLSNVLFSYDRERAKASEARARFKTELETAGQRLQATQQQVDAANAQFQTAKTQLQTAKTQLKTANLAVKTSQADAKKAEADGKKRAAAARKQADAAKKQADAAKRQSDAAVARADAAQSRLSAAQKRVELARKSLGNAKRREEKARRGEFTAQEETRTAKTQSALAKREANAAQTQAESAKTQAESAKTQAENAKKLTRLARRELKAAQDEVKTASETLRITKESLQVAKTSRDKASSEAFRARGEVFIIERQVAALQKQSEALQLLAKATLSNDAPIKINQVFGARIIDAKQSPEAIVSQLREVLKKAQTDFREGEDELSEPRFPSDASVQLLPLPIPVADSNGEPVILEGDAVLKYWADDIVKSGQPTSARLVAPRNFLATESRIELRFVFVPIESAFSDGEVLASLTIDGGQGDALIFNSLLELTNLGRRRAEERKVNPPESPSQPNFYASDTNLRLFEALRLIERGKTRVRVNLVAARALTTVEPLKVRFEIDSEPSAPIL